MCIHIGEIVKQVVKAKSSLEPFPFRHDLSDSKVSGRRVFTGAIVKLVIFTRATI